jgi:hypothetical protein
VCVVSSKFCYIHVWCKHCLHLLFVLVRCLRKGWYVKEWLSVELWLGDLGWLEALTVLLWSGVIGIQARGPPAAGQIAEQWSHSSVCLLLGWHIGLQPSGSCARLLVCVTCSMMHA